ncbi:organic cation transporter protein [Bombyx mori]|uniref:Major facilitator superfamily (MFS) profile domain-containing protein n=1 Tax=Bombyx mori TaxID=7091 RepID=A0A8R2QSY4_BOMMO|nr:organic cation transporter protein [Bombyx mori]
MIPNSSSDMDGTKRKSVTISEKIEETPKQDEDKLIQAIGEFGRWHVMLTMTLSAPIRMTAVWNHLGIIFLAPKTEFICAERRNNNETIQESECYSDCTEYEYKTDFVNTIISEWDLVCDRAWLTNFNQTACMSGVLLGSIVFGFFADRFGRRPALLTACTTQLIAGFTAPFCPNYITFTLVRFFNGAAVAGALLTSFILMIETTGISKRELMNCIVSVPLSVGEMIMPMFSYYLRSWTRYSLGLALPNLVFLVLFFIVPESPKWLISVGRLEEASLIMTKIAKWNRLPTEGMMDRVKIIAFESNVDEHKNVKATYLDLIKVQEIRWKNIGCCLTWFILGLSFYGSNQYIGQTSPNVFVAIAMAGAIQIPGILLSGYLCKRFGRRHTLIFLFILCGISNALLSVPDDWYYFKLFIGSTAVSSASGAFATVYMFTTELFPTVARNMAMGASSTVSRIGSMLAPFIAGLTATGPWIPPTVFGLVPFAAAVACYCLPETRGKKLKDHFGET